MKRVFLRLLFVLICSVSSLSAESTPAPQPERDYSVTFAGAGLSEQEKSALTSFLEFVSSRFQEEFSVRFVLSGFAEWKPANPAEEIHSLLENLKSSVAQDRSEIVIGYVKADLSGTGWRDDLHVAGLAQTFSGYVVLREPLEGFGPELMKRVLLHEAGHLFGAVHVNLPGAVMHPNSEGETDFKFDPDNRMLIEEGKKADFRKGRDSLPPESVKTLISVYERLIGQNPRQDFYYELGHFYELAGNGDKAMETWQAGLRYDHRDPRLHQLLGIRYYEKGEYDRARESLESAVPHFTHKSEIPYKASSLNALGVIYEKKGLYEAAQAVWQDAILLTPDDAGLHANLAALFLETERFEPAAGSLKRALELDPDDPDVLTSAGLLRLRQGKIPEAIQFMQDVLKKKLDSRQAVRANVILGEAHFQAKDYAGARAAWDEALRAAPDHEGAMLNLARLDLAQANYERAKDRLETLKPKKGNDILFLGMLADAYMHLGMDQQALDLLDHGLKAGTGSYEANYRKMAARIRMKRGEWDMAEEQIRLILSREWTDKDAHKMLAQVYERKNVPDEVLRELSYARDLDPKDVEVRYYLGMFYKKAGKKEEARREFEEILRLDPGNEKAKSELATV